ncbi:hypothetical protein [Mesorhizobium sp. STM 4661]|uniref:hypothetical protein n=1 Tax=Mesorhizobium sp. STM 4661 TaxID=1297570 RepID=UPI0002BFA88C|nr:hypothetical protein [Mesorhizobium sp. STM 4661]CCV11781.1 hypothetical protein MESS4_340103 [Mesorhizobium sp. STM 4661]
MEIWEVNEARESELKRESGRIPLAERLAAIAHDLKSRAGKDGRPVAKDEIDDMWGHS